VTIIPILLYHSISDDPPGWIAPFTATPMAFARHVDLIVESGRTAMTVSQLRAALLGQAELPERPVVITFDDGFADFVDAAALLVAHRLPSTLYITTGAMRGRGTCPELVLPPAPMLEWSQLGDLDDELVEIGAHTYTHPQLDTLPSSAAVEEIRRCKLELEDELGREIPSFAYPHGYYSRGVVRAVRDAEYNSACGVMNALSSDKDRLFALARLTICADTTPELLSAWLAGAEAPVAPYPERLRTKAWRAWRRSRARLRALR
jgi:peptidoglycan/xylan/chitin deacetylase (PgdA/CDA1 family)